MALQEGNNTFSKRKATTAQINYHDTVDKLIEESCSSEEEFFEVECILDK